MTLSKKKTPTWLLERVAQGELDAAEVEDVRMRLTAEGRSMETELSALRESNRDILAQLPRETMGAAIRHRAASPVTSRTASRSRLNMILAPLALVGSVGIAILIVRSGNIGVGGTSPTNVSTTNNQQVEEDTTIKGDSPRSPRLLVYRQRPGQASSLDRSERLSDGARGARGDLLQLAYDKAPEGLYGVLLSIDGARRVTQHLPEEGARESAHLTSMREIRLPSAYELDDAPGFERFVLIAAPQPFAISMVLDAARAVANRGPSARTLPLELGPTFRQTSVLLHKISEGTP
jgi:hypothetical protein